MLQPLFKALDIPELDQLCQGAISQQCERQPWKVAHGQRRQADMFTEWQERQENANTHDRQRQQQDWHCRHALEEGDFLGADHMHDQGL